MNNELLLNTLKTLTDSSKRTDELLRTEFGKFNDTLNNINIKIGKLDAMKHTVKEINDWKGEVQDTISIKELGNLIEWKKEINDVISPEALKEFISTIKGDVSDLKTFKTKITMVWVVLYTLLLVAVGVTKVLN